MMNMLVSMIRARTKVTGATTSMISVGLLMVYPMEVLPWNEVEVESGSPVDLVDDPVVLLTL